MGGKPQIGHFAVFIFARKKVDEVHDEPSNHQHFQVETVPVGAEVKRNLQQSQTVKMKNWPGPPM